MAATVEARVGGLEPIEEWLRVVALIIQQL
jgi:hypothetical protein